MGLLLDLIITIVILLGIYTLTRITLSSELFKDWNALRKAEYEKWNQRLHKEKEKK